MRFPACLRQVPNVEPKIDPKVADESFLFRTAQINLALGPYRQQISRVPSLEATAENQVWTIRASACFPSDSPYFGAGAAVGGSLDDARRGATDRREHRQAPRALDPNAEPKTRLSKHLLTFQPSTINLLLRVSGQSGRTVPMEGIQQFFGLNGANGRPFYQCAQCGAAIIASSWSEHVNERCVRDVWTCDTCGYEFETSTVFRTPEHAFS